MSVENAENLACSICGEFKPKLYPSVMVDYRISRIIQDEHSDWSRNSLICKEDLEHYREIRVKQLLALEDRQSRPIDDDIISSCKKREVLSVNSHEDFKANLSFGDKLADTIATFGGSWAFIISFGLFIVVWICFNVYALLWNPPDPYPFILLNLVLSCLAALQAPVIMMSQNRQEAKDRLRSENDYKVNLKAELEIRQLHDKVDHVIIKQSEHFKEAEEFQSNLMSTILREINKDSKKYSNPSEPN